MASKDMISTAYNLLADIFEGQTKDYGDELNPKEVLKRAKEVVEDMENESFEDGINDPEDIIDVEDFKSLHGELIGVLRNVKLKGIVEYIQNR